MLFVVGVFAALAYMYLKKKGLETGIDAQVAEFHAQQKIVQSDDTPPDATYAEIRASWLKGTRTGTEQMNIDLTEKEKRALLKGANDLHEEALLYDQSGSYGSGEIEGVLLEMANH